MPLNSEQLQRCILTLESSLSHLRKVNKGSVEYEVFRNAVIKSFELSLETGGKLLRKAVRAYHANPRVADGLTFKDLLREAARHQLLTHDEAVRWFLYRDNRNNTAHDYGEVFAEETLVLLEDFIIDVKALETRLNMSLGGGHA